MASYVAAADRNMFLRMILAKIRTHWEVVRRIDDRIRNLQVTYNSLSLPRGFVCIGDDGAIHVVSIAPSKPRLSHLHASDVAWSFEPASGAWTVVKDSTGDYAAFQ